MSVNVAVKSMVTGVNHVLAKSGLIFGSLIIIVNEKAVWAMASVSDRSIFFKVDFEFATFIQAEI